MNYGSLQGKGPSIGYPKSRGHEAREEEQSLHLRVGSCLGTS
jgi:hypothetical protein